MATALPGGPDGDPQRQQKFDALAQAMPGLGGKSVEIRYGTVTLTWANGQANSAVSVVTHGLGRAPNVVLVTANGTGGPDLLVCQAFTFTATQFSVQGGFLTGTSAGTTNVTAGWIAIG